MRHFLLLVALMPLLLVSSCLAQSDPLFLFHDPLVQTDEYGVLHQMPRLDQPDFAPRRATRLGYYFESGDNLARDPAYVGALQVALRNNGYYCGPIDGIFSPAVTDAVSRLQKNYALRVSGTLTVGVRRALHLP
jgi:peptidoglycan hydrolase-like protein with peptidoglycan-binding domain